MSVARLSMASLFLLSAACGKDTKPLSTPCTRGELEGCEAACDGVGDCPKGLYCSSDSTCNAECTSETAERDCDRGQLCLSDGRCALDPSGGADAAARAQNDGGFGSGSTRIGGLDGGSADGGSCGFVTLQTTPITPNVILIIDQSSSMDTAFGTSTRWKALKDSLLSDTGLIKELEHVVRFGAAFYSGKQDAATCPLLTEVSLAIDNFQTIKSKYPDKTVADTPTGDSIEAVLKKIPEDPTLDPLYSVPTIFILATDGEPDRCEELNPQNGQQEAIDAVKHAFSRGIRTYIIGVADEVTDEHMQAMANAGVGMTSGNAPKYRANDDKGLRDALRAIVGGQVNCKVPLKGKVTGGTCAGQIKVNGKAVPCSPTEGYQIVDGNAVELHGTPCDAIKKGEVLSAMFECDEAIPLL